jgi:hypothetical protein
MFDVRDEGPLPGLVDLLPASSDALTADSERAIVAELPVGAIMGLTDLRSLVDWFKGRKLVRELPDQDYALPLLECHVPPGGSTVVRTSESAAASGQLELKIFGSGLGGGRKATLSISKDSAPRQNCATYFLDLRVKPRLYRTSEGESIELTILECLGETPVTYKNCPYCGVTPESIDRFTYRKGDHLDLRRDAVKAMRRFELTVEDSASIKGGIKVERVGVDLSVGATVSHGMKLAVESEFVPGFLYQPYARLADGPLQTSMWATRGNV